MVNASRTLMYLFSLFIRGPSVLLMKNFEQVSSAALRIVCRSYGLGSVQGAKEGDGGEAWYLVRVSNRSLGLRNPGKI